jgi:hypothetical protein
MGNPGHKTDPEFNPESLGTVMLIKFGDVPSNLFAESRHIITQCCRRARLVGACRRCRLGPPGTEDFAGRVLDYAACHKPGSRSYPRSTTSISS